MVSVPSLISCAAPRTWLTIFSRPSPMPLIATINWPTSSRRWVSIWTCRFPAAYCSARWITCCSGRVIARRLYQTNPSAKTTTRISPVIRKRLRLCVIGASRLSRLTSPAITQFQPGSCCHARIWCSPLISACSMPCG